MARVLQWTRWLLCENSKGEGGHRGGNEGWWPNSIGAGVGVWARNQLSGNSIAQRSQRGFGVGGQNSIGGSVGVWARNQVQQKSIAQRSQRPQRGIWVGGQNSIGGNLGIWARNQVQRKSIAQRSRKEMGLAVKDSISNNVGIRARIN